MFAICGCSGCVSQRLNDASDAVEQTGNQEYNLNGVRWEVDPIVHQAGATVTWSMATANYVADYIQFDGFISDAQFTSVIRAAFDAWEQVTNIDFVEVSDSSNVDIRLGYGDIDGSSGTLGVAYYSWNGSNELTQSFIEFDSAENWNLNIGGGGPGISAYLVALHEIGHAIGIGHSDDSGAVMAAFLNNSLTGLTQDDIDAGQAIYGSPAAGGGGGTPTNSDPDGVSLSANSVTENASAGTLIGTLTASDPDAGDTHSFEIIAQGLGWSNFEIVGDQLRLASGADIDFEANQSFQLTIRVTDQDNAFFDQSLTVQVDNQAITDIALTSGGSVEESAFGGTSVATFAAFESGTQETAQLSLINNAGGLFVLDGNVLRVANGATLDYETETSHVVRIRATDGTGPAHEENFVIQIENVAISDIAMSGGSVSEDAGTGTSVAQFQVFEGAAGVAAPLTLLDDAGGLFVLDGTTLKLAAGAQLDYETETSHTVRIGAADGNGAGLQEDFVIQVVNVPVQDITLSGNFIAENAAAGTEIGQLQAFDEQVLPFANFTLVDDAGGLFVLDGDILKLASGAQLDFEGNPSHTVRIGASDGSGPAHEEEFTVQLVNAAISDIALATGGSVQEGAAAGTEVARFQAFDDQLESNAQFALLDDAGGRFVLDGNTLRVASGVALDFEDATSHTVRISATDGNGPAREEVFVIQVSNTSINDIALVSGGSIQENAASGTEVAAFEAYEFGGLASAQFSLLDDAGGLFVLEDNVLRVANGAVIDYETATSQTVVLQAVDGSGQPYDEEFVIQIANMAISDIAIASGGSVNENSAADTVVATFEASENPLEPAAVYTLVDDANGLFYLDGNTLKVADGATLDFEVATSHTVRVSATDGNGPAHEEEFVIQVSDTSIDDIALVSGGSIQENAASGTEVAAFEAYEFGGIASAQFSLLDDAGGLFVLEDNVLRVANGAVIDYETATSHTVLLQAVDGSGQPYEEEFVIQIANMAISDIAIASGGSVHENSAAHTVVATFEASENPLEPAAVYTLVDDANGRFYLDGNTLKVADGATLDFEVATSHTVRVSATDGTGPAHEEDFVIAVNDVGGAPITGDGGANKLDGTQENDQIEAGDGDDTIEESAGSDVIDGEGGNDTVVYGGSRSEYQQQLLGPGMVRVEKPGGNSDTLFNIERIDLTDGDFVFDIDSPNIGFSYRIYQAAFGRTPDEGGLRFWTGVLDSLDARGWSDEVKQQYIATQFNQSDEFRDLYGTNPSNFDYIDAMYVNVLFRLPDQEGYDFWVGGMENGLTREQILVAFSESDENVQNNLENLDDGVWVV